MVSAYRQCFKHVAERAAENLTRNVVCLCMGKFRLFSKQFVRQTSPGFSSTYKQTFIPFTIAIFVLKLPGQSPSNLPGKCLSHLLKKLFICLHHYTFIPLYHITVYAASIITSYMSQNNLKSTNNWLVGSLRDKQ